MVAAINSINNINNINNINKTIIIIIIRTRLDMVGTNLVVVDIISSSLLRCKIMEDMEEDKEVGTLVDKVDMVGIMGEEVIMVAMVEVKEVVMVHHNKMVAITGVTYTKHQ